MYKKGPCNVHTDTLSPLPMSAETTTDDCDEIPSLVLSEKFSEHTEINQVANTVMQPKLRYKHPRRDIQPQRDDNAICNSTCLDDMAPDELLANPRFLRGPGLFFNLSQAAKWLLDSSKTLSA